MYNTCIVVKKELKMSDKPYFGMFTDVGNQEIAVIVEHAKTARLTWPETYQLLCKLSQVPSLGEATDTMVREMVYDACGFNSDFYV
jgi:hypothetical protein